jgi:ATP-binding cassette, subfamily B, bacterial IrtA/YbtP
VLENGSIVERGRPDELLAQNGKFAAFWRSHRSAVADEIETRIGVLQGDELR